MERDSEEAPRGEDEVREATPAGETWGIVLAAGGGSRFGEPKQFAILGGVRVVDRAVAAAGVSCDAIVVVLPPGVPWDGAAVAATVVGGDSRSDSVRAGLAAVPAEAAIVVVHDAARPLASPALFDAVVKAVRAGADGAVPGVPVTDTLKRVEGGRVRVTLGRDALVAVQTPQAFKAAVLRAAHEHGASASDDAALVEVAGGAIVVVAGDPANLKLTTPVDLELLDALLRESQSFRHREAP